MSRRRTFRVSADMWTVLQDILVGTPEDFNSDSASLTGRSFKSVYPHHGRMSGHDEDVFRGHRAAGAITYVVYSYSTPIAYRISVMVLGENVNEWIVPDHKYSVTTSKHQGKVRTALSQITGGYNV